MNSFCRSYFAVFLGCVASLRAASPEGNCPLTIVAVKVEVQHAGARDASPATLLHVKLRNESASDLRISVWALASAMDSAILRDSDGGKYVVNVFEDRFLANPAKRERDYSNIILAEKETEVTFSVENVLQIGSSAIVYKLAYGVYELMLGRVSLNVDVSDRDYRNINRVKIVQISQSATKPGGGR